MLFLYTVSRNEQLNFTIVKFNLQVYQFMEARINSAKTKVSSAMRDSVSLILFDHEVSNFQLNKNIRLN
jgi:hypothetical protein